MGFTEGMAPCDQRNGLFVIHSHAGKGLTDIACRGKRIWFAVGAFRIHIDQAHLNGSQRIFQFAVTAIALVAQPCVFIAPVNIFFRLPNVFPTASKAEGFEAHGVKGAIACQDHQVSPRNLVSIFLFNGPQQTAGFVEIGIIRPAVERCETLRARTGSATAIAGAIGACTVPSHANEEWSVMAVIGRPPVLGVGHQLHEIVLQGLQIKFFEFFGIVEIGPHRVAAIRILMKDFQIQLVRPPVTI